MKFRVLVHLELPEKYDFDGVEAVAAWVLDSFSAFAAGFSGGTSHTQLLAESARVVTSSEKINRQTSDGGLQ